MTGCQICIDVSYLTLSAEAVKCIVQHIYMLLVLPAENYLPTLHFPTAQRFSGSFSSLFWFYGAQLYYFGSPSSVSSAGSYFQRKSSDKPTVPCLVITKRHADEVSN